MNDVAYTCVVQGGVPNYPPPAWWKFRFDWNPASAHGQLAPHRGNHDAIYKHGVFIRFKFSSHRGTNNVALALAAWSSMGTMVAMCKGTSKTTVCE